MKFWKREILDKFLTNSQGPPATVYYIGMKPFLYLLVTALAIACAPAQTLTISGQTYVPASTNSSDQGMLKEYVPAGQTIETWSNLFAVRLFKKIASPQIYMKRMEADYRGKYPGMKYASGRQESTGRWFMDFIAYPLKDEPKFVEWNFFRAQTNAAGGIIVFQYAERRPFKKSDKEVFDSWDLAGTRTRMLPVLATNEFQGALP